jgi:hypothetical protein
MPSASPPAIERWPQGSLMCRRENQKRREERRGEEEEEDGETNTER